MRRRLVWGSIVLALASLALVLVPGFDVLSFHFCLPASLLIAMVSGGTAVAAMQEAREYCAGAAAGWRNGLIATAGFLAVPWMIVTASAFLAGPCDYAYGALFYAAGPIASALCAVALGGSVGLVVHARRAAQAIYLVLFCAPFAWNAWDLYHGPAVFFYNPFLGWYPGPVYDTRLEIGVAYVAFRLLCLGGLLFVVALAHALVDAEFRFRMARRPWTWLVAAAGLGIAVALAGQAGRLGFRTGRADLERALPRVQADRFCELRFGPGLDEAQAARLLADCGFRHRQAASFLGIEPGPPVRVWLYPDDDRKARLIGARDVEVTKPWTGEVHITAPLPGDFVLGHEVAHVVAGLVAPGRLAMPSQWEIVPRMAMVEGLAVAIAFADGGPSPHEWTLAMQAAGVEVNPSSFLGTASFLLGHPGRTYTLAGSFVRYVRDAFGPAAVRAIASGGTPDEATGRDLDALASGWHAAIREEAGPSMDGDLAGRARARFVGGGALARRCTVDTARLEDSAQALLADGDFGAACTTLDRALVRNPEDPALLRRLLAANARGGDGLTTAVIVDRLRDARRAAGLEGLTTGDLIAAADAFALPALARGDPAPWETRAYLGEAALKSSGPEQRAVLVRTTALKLPVRSQAAIFRAVTGASGTSAVDELSAAAWATADDGLTHYLAGKALAGAGEWAASLPHLLIAVEQNLPGEPIRPGRDAATPLLGEALRALGVSAYWAGLTDLARERLERAMALAAYEGERMTIEEFLARIRGG